MEPIEVLKTALREERARGNTVVAVDALEQWIATLPPANSKDLDFETWKARAPLEHASRLGMFKSVLEAGQTALKTLIAINGGAAVALLAFLGNLIPKGVAFPTRLLTTAMLVLVVGVGFAGAATGFRYLNLAVGANGRPGSQRLDDVARWVERLWEQ